MKQIPVCKLLRLAAILPAVASLMPAMEVKAETQVPVIDSASDINSIERLKIDSDPTLMTSVTTEWEIELGSPDYANENGHALLYHNGKVYVYLNRYGGNKKTNPVMSAHDANNHDADAVENEIPFSSLSALWNGFSLLNHAVAVDDAGNFLFVFGVNDSSPKVLLVRYTFETNTAEILREVSLNDSQKYNLHNSSLTFSDGRLAGNLDGSFSLTVNTLVTIGTSQFSLPIEITGNDGVFSARRIKPGTEAAEFYNYGTVFSDNNVVDLCEIDDSYMVASHCLPVSFSPTAKLDRISLFERNGGYYALKEHWTDTSLMPSISTSGSQEGDCFGMHVVRHDGHTFLVYAKSYIGSVVYNMALWDDASSFANIRLVGQIKVPGNIGEKKGYERGLRQMVVREPGPVVANDRYTDALSTKDYYASSVFYTYAPGAALAKHRIVTEEDKIYTTLDHAVCSPALRQRGAIIESDGRSDILVYDSRGALTARFKAATMVSLSGLRPGFYIVECGGEIIKAIL